MHGKHNYFIVIYFLFWACSITLGLVIVLCSEITPGRTQSTWCQGLNWDRLYAWEVPYPSAIFLAQCMLIMSNISNLFWTFNQTSVGHMHGDKCVLTHTISTTSNNISVHKTTDLLLGFLELDPYNCLKRVQGLYKL